MLNKTISRRSIIKSLATISVVAVPMRLMAQTTMAVDPNQPTCPPVKIKVVVSEISNNHGHEFTITLDDLVKAGKTNYSIKGSSSHAHGIQITNDVIIDLMQGKVVNLVSSTDASHSHNVALRLA